jgi:tetratricopeptide (TPR) repeat protein
MKMKSMTLGGILLATACALGADAGNSTSPADAGLAEHVGQLALTELNGNWSQPRARYAEALLAAAQKMNPNEGRLARALSDVAESLDDLDVAIPALRDYSHAHPEDRVVQTRLVEMYAQQKETVDEKIAYLQELLNKPPIPEEVRSRAALKCAKLMLERSDRDGALALLGQAVRLDPLNTAALRMRYQLAGEHGTRYERFKALLGIARANPTDPDALSAVAQELASVGMNDAALQWYMTALRTYQHLGQAPQQGFVPGFASTLFISGKLDLADALVTQAMSTDSDSIYLKLLIERDRPTQNGEYAKRVAAARTVMTFKLAQLARIAGDTTATTQPAADGTYTLPDPLKLADLVLKSGDRNFIAAYANLAADLAWLQVYFDEQPVSPALLDGLKKVAGESDPVVTRIDGWNYLVSKKPDEAKVKLSAVADREPLAALGMVRILSADEKNKQEADSLGRKLLSEHASGPVGAQIYDALRSRNLQPVANRTADAFSEEIKKFPWALLNIIEHPDNLYVLRFEPTDSQYEFGQPITGTLTIQSLTDLDLAIGNDGAIRPSFWIDTQLRGQANDHFAGFWTEPLGQELIVRGRQSVSRKVRIDQGKFAEFLASQPGLTAQATGTAASNAIPVQGGAVPGPGGYRVQFTKIFERRGLIGTTPETRKAMIATARTGKPEDRIRVMEGLATYTTMIRGNPAANDLAADGELFAKAIEDSRKDESPAVRAWASYLTGLLMDRPARKTVIDEMASDAAWQVRAMALVEARFTGSAEMSDTAKKLSADASAEVRQLSAAVTNLAESPAEASTAQPGK